MAAARELNLYESQLYHWRSKQQNQLSSSEREQVISAESARLKRQLTERDEVLTIFQNGRDILCETPDGTGSHRGGQPSPVERTGKGGNNAVLENAVPFLRLHQLDHCVIFPFDSVFIASLYRASSTILPGIAASAPAVLLLTEAARATASRRVASFVASVRRCLTMADRPAAVAADVAAYACASFTASSRAIMWPCSIIRAAVWVLTS